MPYLAIDGCGSQLQRIVVLEDGVGLLRESHEVSLGGEGVKGGARGGRRGGAGESSSRDEER